jgi:hypothetical protein
MPPLNPAKFKIVIAGPQLFLKENIQQKHFTGLYPFTIT